jgi:hypothetical protein
MKRKIECTVIFLISLLPFTLPGQEAFKAEMTNVKQGAKEIYQVQSNGDKYRYDFEMGGDKGIVIVDPANGKTAILFPSEKFVHFTETSSMISRSNDPVQAVITLKDRYTEKKLGQENVAGFDYDKTELYATDKKVFTVWFSEKLNFPLKIQSHIAKDTYMELSNITLQKITPSVFEIPEGYTEVDSRMRPIIPEPPAPETWNTIEIDLPFNKEYTRGDLIRFQVPESKNYVINLTNNTAGPAKIIRKTFRDGKELANNEQGPLKYRTKRLFANESSKDTYSWKAGDTKILEVHEGKLTIEIQPENN